MALKLETWAAMREKSCGGPAWQGRVNPETTPHQRQSQTSEIAPTWSLWMQAAWRYLTLQAFCTSLATCKLGTLQRKVVNRVGDLLPKNINKMSDLVLVRETGMAVAQ